MEDMEDVYKYEAEARGRKLLELAQDVTVLERFLKNHAYDLDLEYSGRQAIANLLNFINRK